MMMKQFDCITCLPGRRGGGRSGETQERHFELWFFGNCSVKQPSGRFCLHLNWHWLLWINAHGNGILNIFHRLSSPPVIIFKESHHFFNPGLKVSCFASLPWSHQVWLNFILVWKPIQVNRCKYTCFMLVFAGFRAYVFCICAYVGHSCKIVELFAWEFRYWVSVCKFYRHRHFKVRYNASHGLVCSA